VGRRLRALLLLLVLAPALLPAPARAQQIGPAIVDVTLPTTIPVGGTGATFTATYRGGPGDRALDAVAIHLARAVSEAGCTIHYVATTNRLSITGANGADTPAGSPGTGALVEGRGCALDPAQTLVRASGDTLTVTYRIVFRAELEQTLRVFLEASDRSGLSTFREDHGEVAVGRGAQPPLLGAVGVNQPDVRQGERAVFTAVYRDPNGWSDLAFVYLHIADTTGRSGCMVRYDPVARQLGVRLESEHWVNLGAPGQGRSEQGYRCTLDAGPSSATTEGDTLTVRFAVRFHGDVLGARHVYTAAVDRGAKSAEWVRGAEVNVRTPGTLLNRATDPRAIAGMVALAALGALLLNQRPRTGWGLLAGAALASVAVPTPAVVTTVVAVLLVIAAAVLVAWRVGALDRWVGPPAASAADEEATATE